MRSPAHHLRFRLGSLVGARSSSLRSALLQPVQGFDAARTLSQIVAVQALHYLVLALLVPSCLVVFSRYPSSLAFQGGGVLSTHYILDWRELANARTWPDVTRWNRGLYPQGAADVEREAAEQSTRGSWKAIWLEDGGALWQDEVVRLASSAGGGGGRVALEEEGSAFAGKEGRRPTWEESQRGMWEARGKDDARHWGIAAAWALSGLFDVHLLALLIRRPTHILDHTLTLHLVHLVLTTLYSSLRPPTSLFYWLVMALHAGGCVVWAEAVAIRREMRVGLRGTGGGSGDGGEGSGGGAEEADATEGAGDLGRGRRARGRGFNSIGGSGRMGGGGGHGADEEERQVLFQLADDDDDYDDGYDNDGTEKASEKRRSRHGGGLGVGAGANSQVGDESRRGEKIAMTTFKVAP